MLKIIGGIVCILVSSFLGLCVVYGITNLDKYPVSSFHMVQAIILVFLVPAILLFGVGLKLLMGTSIKRLVGVTLLVAGFSFGWLLPFLLGVHGIWGGLMSMPFSLVGMLLFYNLTWKNRGVFGLS